MKKHIKQIWIDALTSGEYKQATGMLKDGNKMCCLGVLCDLYIKETGNAKWDKDVLGGYVISDLNGDELEDVVLPSVVNEWSGVKGSNGDIHNCKHKNLAEANDSGVKFKKIAELIEEHF